LREISNSRQTDGHFFAVEQAGDEAETLIHLGTLLPRHFALLAKCRSVTYVSGIPCNLSLDKHIKEVTSAT
jgi:hypothetical protein